MCSPNPRLLQVTLGVGYSLPVVCHGAKIGLHCQGMSQLFLPVSTWYSLICPMCRSCSASFLISFRGNGSISSVQFISVTQSCPTLCNPMNHSTPGLPVHHQLPEFTQTHVHRVSDAIQPSHPWLSPSPPVLNPSQHQSLFQ